MTNVPKGFVSAEEVGRRRPVSAEDRDAIDTIKRDVLLEHGLHELREHTGTSQSTIAERMETSRPNISRIEHEDDIRLSTLDRYVRAVGGTLRIVAELPDGESVALLGGDLEARP